MENKYIIGMVMGGKEVKLDQRYMSNGEKDSFSVEEVELVFTELSQRDDFCTKTIDGDFLFIPKEKKRDVYFTATKI